MRDDIDLVEVPVESVQMALLRANIELIQRVNRLIELLEGSTDGSV